MIIIITIIIIMILKTKILHLFYCLAVTLAFSILSECICPCGEMTDGS